MCIIGLSESLKGVIIMLAEVRSRSQITIPVDIVRKLDIKEGDYLDISELKGGIYMCPVVVYPKNKLAQIQEQMIKAADSGKEEPNQKALFDDRQAHRAAFEEFFAAIGEIKDEPIDDEFDAIISKRPNISRELDL